MPARVSVVVFDVNETLSDMRPMADRFVQVGAPPALARLWFTSLLRDGFALAVTGDAERFAVVGTSVLRAMLAGAPLNRDLDAAIQHVMSGFTALSPHPDVVDGVRGLRATGLRLVSLTNGGASVAAGLFQRAGIAGEFEALLSVEEAGSWKPSAPAYAYAAERCGVAPSEMLLVAVHPWDVHGASRAGLGTAWLNRDGASYPDYFASPTFVVAALTELADLLTG